MSDEQTVYFERGALRRLGEITRELRMRRVLLVTGPGRRFVDHIREELAGVEVVVFDGARAHVPQTTVDSAADALRRADADTIITLGGGSATGLGKALRLSHELRFVAIPTTYSGSEMTSVWGISSDREKRTGRDIRVRPDVVLYDPDLGASMPPALTIRSLFNALAQAVGALSTDSIHGEDRSNASDAIAMLHRAVDILAAMPSDPEGRRNALWGASLAGRALERGEMGVHHKLAHLLGGRFGLGHAQVHAILLPHSVAALENTPVFSEILDAADTNDLPAELFDTLVRVGSETSLRALDLDWEKVRGAVSERVEVTASGMLIARDAWLGRRPSAYVRRLSTTGAEAASVRGPPLDEADRIVIALHGRGSTADAIVERSRQVLGDAPGTAIVAPQADGAAWYPKGYRASPEQHGADLTRALELVGETLRRVREQAGNAPLFLLGFSQGACLALEYAARSPERLAAVIALSGARIGPPDAWSPVREQRAGTPVLLAISERDPWVALDDVHATAEAYLRAGARVERLVTPGGAHEMAAAARIRARGWLRGDDSERTRQVGFGDTHETEALPGALPRGQNNPRRAPYGLYPEQVNATGFTVRRADNRRSWMYRIRPSVQHGPFSALAHPTLSADFVDMPAEVNLSGWMPRPLPEEPTDFVDGLATFGGAGDPRLRRGYAIHLYAANRSMEHRAFYDADGELLLVPEHGALTLLTEMGVLDVEPGQVALVPRGVKVSVLLQQDRARGFVAEVFGRHFRLPERGPVGANALSDPRHFRAPAAWHEDRLDPGYRITAKLGGRPYEAAQDYSPFDVVAWHGNLAPYVYDLMRFSPVANVRFDHGDPSVFTVLSAPMDEPGTNSLDFVVFPPRWDATEQTFRPPFFHRNAITEFNGIIRDPPSETDPFRAGSYFLTPSMTAHGVRASAVEHALSMSDAQADRPMRSTDRSLWFQFEVALPLALTSWARTSANRVPNWHHVWGVRRSRFIPPA